MNKNEKIQAEIDLLFHRFEKVNKEINTIYGSIKNLTTRFKELIKVTTTQNMNIESIFNQLTEANKKIEEVSKDFYLYKNRRPLGKPPEDYEEYKRQLELRKVHDEISYLANASKQNKRKEL
tara:strand:- start:1010 stop:1375 length:366 start_codon:yes stop_codon:yes gene_type:complete